MIPFLTQTVDWYHSEAVQTRAADASEVAAANESHALADQIVRAAFDFAQTCAEEAAKDRAAEVAFAEGEDPTPEASQYQSMRQLTAHAEEEMKSLEGEIETTRHKLAGASGPARQSLQSLLAETQSELELARARRDSLRSMTEFLSETSGNGPGGTGVRAQIEKLARSVPGVPLTKEPAGVKGGASGAGKGPPIPAKSSTPTETPLPVEPAGIWLLAMGQFTLARRLSDLDHAIQSTEALQQSARDMQAPLSSKLMELTRRGDELAKAADSAGRSALDRSRLEINGLTAVFKQTSSVNLPLSKQIVLLGVYERGLTAWQNSLRGRYQQERRRLLTSLAFLAGTIAILFGLSALARRAILHYVRDTHRRAQLLTVRRIVLWCAIALVVGLSFAGQIGSVATFAGLLSAGVAVALQNVLVSVAGYFFLTGKYGIRVGDHVQISGVSGEVVEIGLVRLHLMELGGGGAETPTGRLVAFSNSIVFQPSAGIFKRIPGTSFRWHEVTLTLSAENDFGAVKERLHQTMDALFADYDEDLARQSRHMQETFEAGSPRDLRPRIRLRFTDSGLEATIRYPAEAAHSLEMDERVTQELLAAVEREPRLATNGPASANIKLRSDSGTP